MSTQVVDDRLRGYLRLQGFAAILNNVYVSHSPWESDIIRVLPSLFYAEYEIKVSTADFKADFRKSDHWYDYEAGVRSKRIVTRHEFLASAQTSIGSKETARPRYFYFVCPQALILPDDVPPHAGLIYVDTADAIRGWGVKVIRKAPVLKNSTKLSSRQLYNLLRKACYKRF